jgi:hypothetical protein
MSENMQLVNHIVNSLHEIQHLSLNADSRNLLIQITLRHSLGRDGDSSHLEC